jgi:putative DNA primase/helicase
MGGPAPDEEGHEDTLLERHERATQLVAFLQRAIGYSLTGDVSEQCFFLLYGTGANGKSTLINTILLLLALYGMKATTELLMQSKNDRHPTERADLFGKRFVAAIETEEGHRLHEAFLKEVTGGDRIRARRMREDFWEFEPTHKVWLATNHKPTVKGTDHALWRRIKLIPFTVQIPEKEQDKRLPATLQGELPGILAWAVRGCLAWQKDGLGVPEEVTIATAGYRAEMDVVGQFLQECCVAGQHARVKASHLYDAYRKWCDASGEMPMVQRNFGLRLSERGFQRYTNNGSWWRGLGVMTEGTERTERM